MFYKREKAPDGREGIHVTALGSYDLADTLECGQCFRHLRISDGGGMTEYVTVAGEFIFDVAQEKTGELWFFGINEESFLTAAVPYFSLETDYEKIREDIISRTSSEWLKRAAECAKGIAILKQDAWEALFSFIVSQNNNIPRIKKMISRICAEYGTNISLQNGLKKCPFKRTCSEPCEEICKQCGACYTFPTADAVRSAPEKLLTSNPGFRYKYLCDAAEKVGTGAVDLKQIAAARSYEYTMERLKEIKGVGEKVASCTALFGFGNMQAFPVDVWMKRAIDEYFNGSLEPSTLGRYAGVAQQYIFHYIRNLENGADKAKE